jgi:hypothetical protein
MGRPHFYPYLLSCEVGCAKPTLGFLDNLDLEPVNVHGSHRYVKKLEKLIHYEGGRSQPHPCMLFKVQNPS